MNPRVLQASLLLERGRFLEAETLLRAALDEGPQSAEVHAMLGLCLKRAGLHEEAKAKLQEALALDPNCAYVHYALSFVLMPANVRDTRLFSGPCLKHIQHALELEPENVSYLIRLAELRQMLGQWKESLEPIEHALQRSPQDVGLAVRHAEALIHLGRRDEAREVLLGALASDPEASNAHAGMNQR